MNISRKSWFVLLIIIAILVVILMVVNSKKDNVEQNGVNNSDTTNQNITQTKQGEVEVTDVSVTSDGTLTNVSAQVTNNDNKTYSMVDISIIFYDANKSVLSTAKGLIENLEPGDKKGFSSSISGDFSKSSTYEVKIDKVE